MVHPKKLQTFLKQWSLALQKARKVICLCIRAFNTPDRLLDRILNLIVSVRWQSNTEMFTSYLGRPPNYASPVYWTDKMQWRKGFDRNPLFQIFCDKVRVRDYVTTRVSGLSFPEFYWIGTDPDLLPFDELSRPYVVKPNHRSGAKWIICQPQTADRHRIIAACRAWLMRPHGRLRAEWGYQGIEGKIIVEEYLGNVNDTSTLLSYRFYVFSGKVVFVMVDSRTTDEWRFAFLDRNGRQMRVRIWFAHLSPNPPAILSSSLKTPPSFQKMVSIAECLGEEIDHIRVDLYELDGHIYFSELTSYAGSGQSYLYYENAEFESVPPVDLDEAIGSEWILPTIPIWKKFYRGICG
jgi:hypothetical protein